MIVLDTKKAFPAAFGYGENITGGRGGTIIEVTNLNDSGTGSLREALLTTGARIILIRVSGVINLSSNIELTESHSDFTLIGYTATGDGTIITGGAFGAANGNRATNVIIRGVTWRPNSGSVGNDDTFSWVDSNSPTSVYIANCSLGYGFDEIITIKSADTATRVTVAYNLLAEAHQDHNRGSIMGSQPSDSPYAATGNFTFARNMGYNIGARFPPNAVGTAGIFEMYNNLIVNANGRMTRFNGDIHIDWHSNYAIEGNATKTSGGDAPATNKFGWQDDGLSDNALIYTGNSIIEGFNIDTSSNQRDLWTYFYNSGSGRNKGVQVEDIFFSSTRLADTNYPPNGLLTAQETKDHLLGYVGACRKTDVNGEPVEAFIGKDSTYIDKSTNGTTESSYRTQSNFDIPTRSSSTQYPDNTVQYLPDAWVAKHSISSVDQVKAIYTFDSYTVANNAGYTALEIWLAYVAGDFDLLNTSVSPITALSGVKASLSFFIHS